jgi:hypothetical protein
MSAPPVLPTFSLLAAVVAVAVLKAVAVAVRKSFQ